MKSDPLLPVTSAHEMPRRRQRLIRRILPRRMAPNTCPTFPCSAIDSGHELSQAPAALAKSGGIS